MRAKQLISQLKSSLSISLLIIYNPSISHYHYPHYKPTPYNLTSPHYSPSPSSPPAPSNSASSHFSQHHHCPCHFDFPTDRCLPSYCNGDDCWCYCPSLSSSTWRASRWRSLSAASPLGAGGCAGNGWSGGVNGSWGGGKCGIAMVTWFMCGRR